MSGDFSADSLRVQNLVKNNFCAGTNFRKVSLSDFVTLRQQADTQVEGDGDANCPATAVALGISAKAWEKARQSSSPAT
jgi:hypothetical protein